jgi:cation diffusion facilitator CzcD-associated flavoprotein CzcO
VPKPGADFDVVVVGAGFAGLYQLRHLRALGLRVVLLEAGTGLGGIWHWNCYPGARVDSHVPLYEFSDEAVWKDWYWDERFPDWRALRGYFEHVDGVWDLQRDIRFATRLGAAQWREDTRTWALTTDHGDTVTTRFVVLCTGFAAKPYIPDLPGLDTFAGPSPHTAQWPQDGLDMTNLRVGVIGTGASGVQVTQEAAKVASHVTVFQRTPILALAMQQRRLTRAEQDAAKVHYPARYRKRTESQSGFDYDSAGDSALSVPAAERRATFERLWQEGGFAFWAGGYADLLIDEAANRLAYDFWRERVLDRISDPAVAATLAPAEPPHPFGVKRPSLEQTYYDVFNQDNVVLVDLRRDPIRRVTPLGVETASSTYPLDVLVLATGFDAVTGGLMRIDIAGVGGEQLRNHWAAGVRTHLGLASARFPNLLFVYGPQSPSGFCNGPTCAEVQGDWIIELLHRLHDEGITRIEATAEAEETWRNNVHGIAAMTLFPRADSWYMGANIPGKPREMLNWPGGLQLYLSACRASAAEGYSGFVLG